MHLKLSQLTASVKAALSSFTNMLMQIMLISSLKGCCWNSLLDKGLISAFHDYYVHVFVPSACKYVKTYIDYIDMKTCGM